MESVIKLLVQIGLALLPYLVKDLAKRAELAASFQVFLLKYQIEVRKNADEKKVLEDQLAEVRRLRDEAIAQQNQPKPPAA